MFLTITTILSLLVCLNFLLLIFSCNKSTKKEETPLIKASLPKPAKKLTRQSAVTQLAPTGS